jgi:hypothetical protein
MTHQQQSPEPEKKPIWTRWWMIVIYVIVGLGIIGSLAGEDTDGEPIAGEATSTTEAESSDTTEPEDTTTISEATTTTAEATTTTTQPATTTTEAPIPQPDPVEFSGSGNEVIEFDPELAGWLTETFGIFAYEVSGSGNNAVWALGSDFEPIDLLVNTIGSDAGTRFISLTDDATGLEVEVSGPWTFTISPPTKVSPATTAEDFNVPIIDTPGPIQEPPLRQSIGKAFGQGYPVYHSGEQVELHVEPPAESHRNDCTWPSHPRQSDAPGASHERC